MSDTAPSRPTVPSRGRAMLYVLVIFVAGAVFGSALTIGVTRFKLQRAKNPATWNVEAMHRLDRHLELTPEQRARVQPILADMAGRLRDARIASRREWMAIVHDTRQRLRAELTPEQQVEFDKLAARTRERLGRFLGAPAEPGRRGTGPDPEASRERP